ncbi:MAG TPA: endolytic transglycosylase MltG [Solirubrobacteraceae bacterium]|nr:endolytic transglycosylase MltG [Solirubrobacteraceae bacterium]
MAPPQQPRGSHPRSAEEREHAREQRALRRAGTADSPANTPDPAADEAGAWPDEPSPQGGEDEVPRAQRFSRARRLRGGPPARGRARARVAAVAALIFTGVAAWFLVSLFQPFAGPGSGSVIVLIPKGSSASRVGSILARDGVVSSGFFFELRALLEGKRGDLHSGRFQLRRNMSYAAAIDALSAPPPAVIAVKVVIPEGFTRLQIARLAQQDALSGSYLQASGHSQLLDPARYGAPRGAGLEGFLFPATYQLSAGDPAARLVADQLRAFQVRFGPALERRARALGLSPYELLTVASMIEREAQVARDRPLIAAVIYNRLRLGMPLGIDATIYYALALREGLHAYEGELTAADLRIDSPYNTRLHTGLPPTPIANPGVASIEAAAHPARAPYLYYVAAPDGCGEHVFSSSFAQFEADAAAYQAALRRNGGHLPACKKK